MTILYKAQLKLPIDTLVHLHSFDYGVDPDWTAL